MAKDKKNPIVFQSDFNRKVGLAPILIYDELTKPPLLTSVYPIPNNCKCKVCRKQYAVVLYNVAGKT